MPDVLRQAAAGEKEEGGTVSMTIWRKIMYLDQITIFFGSWGLLSLICGVIGCRMNGRMTCNKRQSTD